jgi:hypothetical protein
MSTTQIDSQKPQINSQMLRFDCLIPFFILLYKSHILLSHLTIMLLAAVTLNSFNLSLFVHVFTTLWNEVCGR